MATERQRCCSCLTEAIALSRERAIVLVRRESDRTRYIAILTWVKYRHSFFVHGSWFMVHR